MELEGKVAVITGGVVGIGRATATAFAEARVRRLIVDMTEQAENKPPPRWAASS